MQFPVRRRSLSLFSFFCNAA
uniref:Uncharacterized protein n=1 Tax=Arundo donax TaxID=35708 RepID=A0A0A9ESN6_ARUDO